MFDLANATELAYRESIKKNPKLRRGTPATIEFEDLDGNPVSMDTAFLGKGTWSIAYKTPSDDVIIIVDETPTSGDPSKRMLSDWNEARGELAHVPLVERIGCHTFGPSSECIFSVYRSPLYKPFKRNAPEKAWQAMFRLEKIVDKSKQSTQRKANNHHQWSKLHRMELIQELEKSKAKLPNYWEESDRENWEILLETLIQMIQFSFQYKHPFLLEVSTSNVGFDGNNQLIFLDLFFDVTALSQQSPGNLWDIH